MDSPAIAFRCRPARGRGRLFLLAASLVGAATAAAPAAASETPDPAADLFVRKCASCHTVGRGDRVGPDLKGVLEKRDRDFVRTMIATPSALLDRDPRARELLGRYGGVRMPDLELSEEEVSALMALLERCSAAPCDLAPKFKPVTKATEEDIAYGRRLFVGLAPFSAGGPSCLSCHDVSGRTSFVGGGTLAPDLTHAFARLGDEGLGAALKNPAFPLMKDIYGERPLTDDEAFAVRAFLWDANRSPAPRRDTVHILLVGLVGAGVMLGGLNLAWSRRLRGVRQSLVGRRKDGRNP